MYIIFLKKLGQDAFFRSSSDPLSLQLECEKHKIARALSTMAENTYAVVVQSFQHMSL